MIDIKRLKEHYNLIAPKRLRLQKRNNYYYSALAQVINKYVSNANSVVEIGCGIGYLLNKLKVDNKIGVDISEEMISVGKSLYPKIDFKIGNVHDVKLDSSPDLVVLSDILGESYDIQLALESLHSSIGENTTVVITQYNYLWKTFLLLFEKLKLKTSTLWQNFIPLDDLENFLDLTDYEVVSKEYILLFPKFFPVVSWLFNSVLTKLPFLKKLCLVEVVVARPVPAKVDEKKITCSVIVACKEEKGNIEDAVTRLPDFSDHLELIFVDGDSKDGTVEEIERCIEKYKDKDIKLIKQIPNKGKGDAVRKGFNAAKGDVLMILDADLTVAPEDLPKFFNALVAAKGTFINGTRLVYPMEDQAMRTLNYLANRFFGMLFSYLLGQRITDTLCGTKVLFKADYEKIVRTRSYFGDFDPFGDFDLLFGASHNNLQIIELPIVYRNRVWGDIKIHRFRHGLILLKMAAFAFWKLKVNKFLRINK